MTLIIDLLFLFVIAIIIISHIRKGFLSSLFGLIRSLLVLFLSYTFGDDVSHLLAERVLANPVRNAVGEKLQKLYAAGAETFDVDRVIDEIPSFAMSAETESKLRALDATGESLVEAATDAVSGPITTFFANVAGYLLVFIVSAIVCSLLLWGFNKIIEHVTVLNVINRLLGALLGIVLAFIVSVAVASVIRFFFGTNEAVAASVAISRLSSDGLLSIFRFLDIGAIMGRLIG